MFLHRQEVGIFPHGQTGKITTHIFMFNTITISKLGLLEFSLCLLMVASPIFQPYLLNPNIIPFYTTSLCWLIYSLFVCVKNKTVCIHWLLLILFFLIVFFASLSFSSFSIVIICTCITFIIFSQSNHTTQKLIFSIFFITSIIWTILALFVWLGATNGNALHVGLWALTSDAGLKPNGPFVNGNVLAIFNACAWLIATVYALTTQKWQWWLLALFFLCAVVISMAWGAWLAILPIVVWLLVYCLIRKNYHHVFLLLLSIACAWYAGHAVVNYVIHHDVVGAEKRLNHTSEHGIDERKLIWLSTYKVWQDYPWLGVGLGKLSAYYLTYQSKVLTMLEAPLPEQAALNSAHNFLLQLMAEMGVFGLFLWLSITIWLFLLSWRYRMRITTSRVWPSLACAWLLWIQGMGNITLSRPYPILMFALFLAIASAPSFRRMTKTIIIPKKIMLLLLCLMIPYLAWTSVDKTQAWLAYEDLMYSNSLSSRERLILTQSLVKESTILPYLISGMIGNRLLSPELIPATLALKPYLQQALQIRQDPRLLQQIFYMNVLEKNWADACAVGKVLQPMKREKENVEAYTGACHKKTPKVFSFH